MFATTKGPYHYDCSLPCLLGWRISTMSPRLMFFHNTFLSLQVFVSWWYLSRFDAACNLVFSVVSRSTYRCIRVVAAVSVRKDPNLSSSGVMASSPYRRRNGVNPVVLVCKMLWPQTDVTNSYAHFPFGISNSAFDTAPKLDHFPFWLLHCSLGDWRMRMLVWSLIHCKNF